MDDAVKLKGGRQRQSVAVPFHDPSVRFDIDTEQDYLILKEME